MNRTFIKTILYAILIITAAITLAPLVWMLSASFMPTGDASAFPPPFFPKRFTLEHYFSLFTRGNLARYLFNSAFLSIAVTFISLIINSMAGYAFAKYRFAGRESLFKLLVASMVIPSQVTMLPLFLMLNKMGFINTYMGVIIPGMAGIFGIFLIRQFAMSIPDSLIEAARIDGAGDFRIYWSLILPLCKPILITLGIFTFMGTWNDFLWPLIVMTDDSMYTLPVAVANLSLEHVHDTELMMAGAVMTVLPVLILFASVQKYYISGIMAGGLKGE
ncbi:MAG: carbohydrate ABC transporter permease [Ignavibacteriae bacterium]|nr:carbohydrate ABC transporter permease [Ignavibacteriota bacterium]